MKKRILLGILVPLFAWSAAAYFGVGATRPFCVGLSGPMAACYSPRGVMYVAESGLLGQAGDGRISFVDAGRAKTLVAGLDDPQGIAIYDHELYATDRTKVVRIDISGKTSDYLTPDRFPQPPQNLTAIAGDRPSGRFLIADSGRHETPASNDANDAADGPKVYCVDAPTLKVDVVADRSTIPELRSVAAVAFEGASSALIADALGGTVYRVRIDDRAVTKLADGLAGVDGMVWDHFGRLFLSSSSTGKVYAIPKPNAKPIVIAENAPGSTALCLDADGNRLVTADRRSGTLTQATPVIPDWEVDERPAAIALRPVFTKLQWTGWQVDEESGRVPTLRPIAITHAGDGSRRLFVALQNGVIHSFADDDSATETELFLDISARVRFRESMNEEGLLGLAFHPRFAETGELFVFYTDARSAMANVVSRFRVRSDDPTVADPASEEVLIRFEKPNDYHNGGAIAFGHDGLLYISHGDGGPQGDPNGNAQNLAVPFGKVLRIDVDQRRSDARSDEKPYGIPADNPFVARSDAMPEVWCYGLRNTWRLSVDRATGRVWGGDVGQGFYEEVNILAAGKNYGWGRREGLHPFGPDGCGPRQEFVEPVWEYHHALGPSVTGGVVYRGRAIPELIGAYVYGDYVSNRVWALRYDETLGRTVSNRPLGNSGVPIMSFGEDEAGEVYVVGLTNTGRGIYRLTQGTDAAR